MTPAPREITVLGASGATGTELTRQALERGHTVVAIARRPDGIALPDQPRLHRRAADVLDPDGIAGALQGRGIVVCALGVTGKEAAGVLTSGARAVVTARPGRVVWLGAFGTGVSARAAGSLTRAVLALALRGEIQDKVVADTLVLDAGGTVVHAGPLSKRALSPSRRAVPLAEAPRRLFPAPVGRATVAATMLDLAEGDEWGVVVPLER